jgi:hypothetical protein
MKIIKQKNKNTRVLSEDVSITILDIIHRPVFYLRHDVSETGLYLHLQVELTQTPATISYT